MNKKKLFQAGCACFLIAEGVLLFDQQPLHQPLRVAASTRVVKDVMINWLADNTDVFLGSELAFEATVIGEPGFDNFVWALNQEGIAELSSERNKAQLRAMTAGEVEVSACVPDGSESCLHRNLHIRAYGQTAEEQAFVSSAIRAVMRVGLTTHELYVEADALLSDAQQITGMDAYLTQLVALGRLQLLDQRFHERFEYYQFALDGQAQTLTIRVDTWRASAPTLRSQILNYEAYNEAQVTPPVEPEQPVPPVEPEGPVPPVEPEQPVPPVEPEGPTPPVEPEQPVPPVEPEGPTPPTQPEQPAVGDLTLGIPGLEVNHDADRDGSFDAPYQVQTVPMPMLAQQAKMAEYIAKWQMYRDVTLISRYETATQIIYKYKISPRWQQFMRFQGEGDLYLEFIIDKDGETTVPLISEHGQPSDPRAAEGESVHVQRPLPQEILRVEAQEQEKTPEHAQSQDATSGHELENPVPLAAEVATDSGNEVADSALETGGERMSTVNPALYLATTLTIGLVVGVTLWRWKR